MATRSANCHKCPHKPRGPIDIAMLHKKISRILYPNSHDSRFVNKLFRIDVRNYKLDNESVVRLVNIVINNLKPGAGYWDRTRASLSQRLKCVFDDLRVVNNGAALNRSWRRFSEQYWRCALARVRQVLDRRARRAVLFSAAAACSPSSDQSVPDDELITDEELEEVVKEGEAIQQLMLDTLYCGNCHRRRLVDKPLPDVLYCSCKQPNLTDSDGWTPYMESADVIIWRKEYKKDSKLYAYKVYGRYPEVCAADFVNVQLDASYRRAWDTSVASVNTLASDGEHEVIHWEVMWPRMFANRDYVFIRRASPMSTPKNASQGSPTGRVCPRRLSAIRASSSNSSAAAGKAGGGTDGATTGETVALVSRACKHSARPPSRRAVRVTEYWSTMMVRDTASEKSKTGTEFVLTYYDEPAPGGLPGGVTAWVAGRAAYDYLGRMRSAALGYNQWRRDNVESRQECVQEVEDQPADEVHVNSGANGIREQDMETWKRGPIITETGEELDEDGQKKQNGTNEQSKAAETNQQKETMEASNDNNRPKTSKSSSPAAQDSKIRTEDQPSKIETEGCERDSIYGNSWWRYLHPFYYFA